ncbi:hypothetical protein ElyMa_001807900 [Elysia marginata]|uniref:Uncharacterized protein n=1 Tax=Elysia marginata TaxID=1093978 RepID=A0AAV4EHF5_9GAST|nr:hypothetical protein ElyMa_001807900 [Elysia marginata]
MRVNKKILAAARWRWQDYKLTVKVRKLASSKTSLIVSKTKKPLNSPSNSRTASLAYQQKWVGFPELSNTVNCTAALSKSVKNSMFAQQVSRVTATKYLYDSTDCSRFRKIYGFDRYPEASDEELNFPIAFIILFNQDLDQVRFNESTLLSTLHNQ